MQYNTEIPIYLQVIEDLKKKMVQGEFSTRPQASLNWSLQLYTKSIKIQRRTYTAKWKRWDTVLRNGE